MVRLLFRRHKSQTIVELLVAIGLLAILIPTLITGVASAREGKPQLKNRLTASGLLNETIEATISAKNDSWANLSNLFINTDYHPEISSNKWTVQSGSEDIILNEQIFNRSLQISDVYRNSQGYIVSSGGILDPSSKLITAEVSWASPAQTSIRSQVLLTRSNQNAIYTESVSTDFSSGIPINTSISGDTIILSSISGGGFESIQNISNMDLAGNSDANCISVVGNYAYVCRSNTGNSIDFEIIDISDRQNPTLVGSLNSGSSNSSIAVDGNYAYLASDGNSNELTIVNISDKSNPIIASTLDLPRNQNGLSIYKSGDYVYLGRQRNSDSELYIINVSNPIMPSISGSIEINKDVTGIFIQGNYCYITTTSNSEEFIVVDISNPSSSSIVTSYDLPSNSDGKSIFVLGSTAYIGTLNNNSGSEFYALNISNLSSINIMGSFNVGGDVKAVNIVGDYAILGTTQTGSNLNLLDISDFQNISSISTFDGGGDINGIAVDTDYIYTVSSGNSSEFAIWGGGGTGGYQTSGTFESQTFDAGSSVGFNHLTFNSTLPTNTSLQVQIAISDVNPPTDFIGPDGLNTSYFTTPGPIYFGSSEGRYFRYKVFFDGDGTNTPIFDSISVNYSP